MAEGLGEGGLAQASLQCPSSTSSPQGHCWDLCSQEQEDCLLPPSLGVRFLVPERGKQLEAEEESVSSAQILHHPRVTPSLEQHRGSLQVFA